MKYSRSSAPGTSVSLSESRRSGSIVTSVGSVFRVRSGRRSGFTQALVESAVGVVSGHDPLASHDIEFVLALQSGVDVLAVGGTDSETELVVRDEAHPFLVEDVGAANVGSDVAADGVAQVFSAVGVEFSACWSKKSSESLS